MHASLAVYNTFLRFTSAATPAEPLMANMVAGLFFTCVSIGRTQVSPTVWVVGARHVQTHLLIILNDNYMRSVDSCSVHV